MLTGKTRYRAERRWRRTLLVLQVEEKHEDGPPDTNGLPEWLAATGWRDARVEDLAELASKEGR